MTTHQDVVFEGLRGYLAQPDGPSRGGVLVLPGHYGLEERARLHGDLLAQAGLTALVFDQYSSDHPRTPTREEAAPWGSQLNDAKSLAQMSTSLGYLQDEVGVSTLGTIGFCQGGRFALLLAARDRRLAACVTFYPSLFSPNRPNQDLDAVTLSAEIRCPVQLAHAGRDHITKSGIFTKLRDILEARSEPTLVEVYPEGDHGFMTVEEHPGPGNDIARALSWPRATAFLQATLLQ